MTRSAVSARNSRTHSRGETPTAICNGAGAVPSFLRDDRRHLRSRRGRMPPSPVEVPHCSAAPGETRRRCTGRQPGLSVQNLDGPSAWTSGAISPRLPPGAADDRSVRPIQRRNRVTPHVWAATIRLRSAERPSPEAIPARNDSRPVVGMIESGNRSSGLPQAPECRRTDGGSRSAWCICGNVWPVTLFFQPFSQACCESPSLGVFLSHISTMSTISSGVGSSIERTERFPVDSTMPRSGSALPEVVV